MNAVLTGIGNQILKKWNRKYTRNTSRLGGQDMPIEIYNTLQVLEYFRENDPIKKQAIWEDIKDSFQNYFGILTEQKMIEIVPGNPDINH